MAATPYFGWDIARDLSLRMIPPRVAYNTNVHTMYAFTHTSYYPITDAIYICAPDDGYVILSGSAVLQNNTPNMVVGNFGFAMDQFGNALEAFRGYQDIQPSATETISLNQTYFITAGNHYFSFVLALPSGGTLHYDCTSLSVIYIDHQNYGISALSRTEE